MDSLLEALRRDFPSLEFVEGSCFYWSPQSSQIFYSAAARDKQSAGYSILHEVAHALLNHRCYTFDYELLQLEVSAWEHAKTIARRYRQDISDDYIQHCLDSYRDWLYKRSICPSCGSKSLQCNDASYYQCFNCHSRWHVASSKFCRPYRHFKGHSKSPATIAAGDILQK
jgi:hypothetical protein